MVLDTIREARELVEDWQGVEVGATVGTSLFVRAGDVRGLDASRMSRLQDVGMRVVSVGVADDGRAQIQLTCRSR